jgi:hypothetical protein
VELVNVEDLYILLLDHDKMLCHQPKFYRSVIIALQNRRELREKIVCPSKRIEVLFHIRSNNFFSGGGMFPINICRPDRYTSAQDNLCYLSTPPFGNGNTSSRVNAATPKINGDRRNFSDILPLLSL